MAYKIKSKGRPKATYKVRSISGITPKGFEFHKIKRKTKINKKGGQTIETAIIYKKKDGI